MPFSFSDWFNFGLAQDVASLWRISPMSYADSVFYRVKPHAYHSNFRELKFHARLSSEQHIYFSFFSQNIEGIALEYHNDLTSLDASLSILSDNFVLCDLAEASLLFEKYNQELTNVSMQYHCITRAQWLRLAEAGDRAPQSLLDDAIREFEAFSGALEVPVRLSALHLRARTGRHIGNLLRSTGSGLFFYGPYVTLKGGRYSARLLIASAEGQGTVGIRVTSSAGEKRLAERKLVWEATTEVKIDFDVEAAGEGQIEFLCELEGSLQLALEGVIIEGREAPRRGYWFGLSR